MAVPTKPCASIRPITIPSGASSWEFQIADPAGSEKIFRSRDKAKQDVAVGDTYRIGTALVQISQPRAPCWKLGRRWNRLDMPKLVVQSGRTGWYLRVLETGDVECGDTLTLVDRPFARWTIDAVNAVRTAAAERSTSMRRASWRTVRRSPNRGAEDSGTLSTRYRADELVMFASALLERAGMPRDRARTMADVMVEGDLLGHDTHGLDQLAGYLVQIEEGRLATSGDPEVVADLGACLTWDGRRLPGHWLVKQAIAEARHRILAHPIVTVVIGRGHHIGCLQAYLKPVTDAGFIILLMCSDPSAAGVTPHGGVASRITPNPIAAGFPTGGDPILIDISSSTSTNAMNKRLASKGERLKGPWIVDADGRATDDPARALRRQAGRDAAARRTRAGPQGIFARAHRRSAHVGACGPRAIGKAGVVDLVGLRAADRSGCVRRARRVRARNAAPRRAVPRHAGRAGQSAGSPSGRRRARSPQAVRFAKVFNFMRPSCRH